MYYVDANSTAAAEPTIDEEVLRSQIQSMVREEVKRWFDEMKDRIDLLNAEREVMQKDLDLVFEVANKVTKKIHQVDSKVDKVDARVTLLAARVGEAEDRLREREYRAAQRHASNPGPSATAPAASHAQPVPDIVIIHATPTQSQDADHTSGPMVIDVDMDSAVQHEHADAVPRRPLPRTIPYNHRWWTRRTPPSTRAGRVQRDDVLSPPTLLVALSWWTEGQITQSTLVDGER